MTYSDDGFGQHDPIQLDSGDVKLVASTTVGPRILGLIGPRGRNIFAELPDLMIECPGTGPSHLYGGHRLWAGPEDPRVTYRPEDGPVEVERLANGFRLTGPADPIARIRRSIAVSATGTGCFTLVHQIENTADDAQVLAPWAITMMPSGGRAWLPLLVGPHDEGGFQANRNIVLWPYTRLDDPRLQIHDALLEARTDRDDLIFDGPVKVGTAMRRGWIAHWSAGILFVKRTRHDEDARHADLQATAQTYWNGVWGELETLGPLRPVAPGGVAEHVETWEVHAVDEAEAERLVGSDALDEPGDG
jgi:hypothetical protein